MARLISPTTMTVDGLTDADEWFGAEGDHDRAARGQFDDAAGINDAVRDGHSTRRTEISVDRLKEIPTDELTQLAEQLHVLTVRMYEELCTRRVAERGTAEVEAIPREKDGSAA